MKRRKKEEKRGKRRRGAEGKTHNNIRGTGRGASAPTNQKQWTEREPLLPRHREAAEHLAAMVNSVQSSKSPSTEKWLLEILIRQSSDINIFKVRNKK